MSEEIPIHPDPAVALRRRWKRTWIMLALVVLLGPVAGYWFFRDVPQELLQSFFWKLRPPVAGPGAVATANAQMAGLQLALLNYYVKSGAYPTQAQGLQALMTRPTTPPIPAKWSAIMETLPRDPWNHPYVYRIPSTNPAMAYDLESLGPDGVPSSDDIVISTPQPHTSGPNVFKLEPSGSRDLLNPMLRLDIHPPPRRAAEDLRPSTFDLRPW